MALRPYPTAIPPETWAIVSDAIAGVVPSVPHAVHCAEDCLAFGLGQFLPDSATPAQMQACGSVDLEAGRKWIKEASTGKKAVLPAPWGSIISMLLQLLSSLIGTQPAS